MTARPARLPRTTQPHPKYRARLNRPHLSLNLLLRFLFLTPFLTFLLPTLIFPPKPRVSPSIPRHRIPFHDIGPKLPPPSAKSPSSLSLPRPTRHAIHGSRARKESAPMLRAILLRSFDDCQSNSTAPSLAALVRQSLLPQFVTVLHSCIGDRRAEIRRELRAELENLSPDSSYKLAPTLNDHACIAAGNDAYEICILNYLVQLAASDPDAGMFLLSDRSILETTAVEKAYMYLASRDVSSLRLQPYNVSSLILAKDDHEPMRARPWLPETDPYSKQFVLPLPVYYNARALVDAAESFMPVLNGTVVTTVAGNDTNWQSDANTSISLEKDVAVAWRPFIRILEHGRLLRQPLFTRPQDNESARIDMLSLGKFVGFKNFLPVHLMSELVFYRKSAWSEEEDMYRERLDAKKQYNADGLDLSPVPFRAVEDHAAPTIMLVMPWMQMGGSEKCMLEIGERVLSMGWRLSIVLTMPFWREDPVGEINLQHQWMEKALALTSDVFDLVQLAPNEKETKLFKYMLQSRSPDYVLVANTRWAYSHSSFIKSVLPDTVMLDYNHMIHMNWDGGGLPRFGANNSEYFDLHLTASEDVASSMRKWIDPTVFARNPEKVKPCYIGTDPDMLLSGENKAATRMAMREKLGISQSAVVVLYAGRFVIDKGTDVMVELMKRVVNVASLNEKLVFVFVGSGPEEQLLREVLPVANEHKKLMIIQPPAMGMEALREYYAMADIFFLPSVNEGIALVLYEAMAAGMLAVATDVGGQKELVTEKTGVLVEDIRSLSGITTRFVYVLKQVLENPSHYDKIRLRGQEVVREKFTTKAFCDCVMDSMLNIKSGRNPTTQNVKQLTHPIQPEIREKLVGAVQTERFHGLWNRRSADRPIENSVTVGIKTYVCDMTIVAQVHNLVRSIRLNHPRVRILLGNDGPTQLSVNRFIKEDPYTEEIVLPRNSGISYGRNYMVNRTITKYFVLLDDDHVFDEMTNLTFAVNGLRDDNFDIVGMRVRNLPGIDELERIGIVIPRYVAIIRRLEDKELTLCVWNENKGPSIFGIVHPIPVDVLHNAFIAKTAVLRAHPWDNRLKVNEHMTFFLDARDANLKVGYLPSVFVHHHPRDYSNCYYNVRFQEEKYQSLLRYKDQFYWDMKCQAAFPERVRQHILTYELGL